jgi:ankyrin repeat protein
MNFKYYSSFASQVNDLMLKKIVKIVFYLIVAAGFSYANAGAYEDFLIAVDNNDAGTVQRLLQRGMDPNTRDEKGQPALTLALRGEAFPVAEALLASPQVDVNAANAAGETPLMMAALKGQAAWVKRLVERGARVQQPGWSPVLYAASGPDPQVLSLLLDKGATVDARSPNGTTPLMMAARYGTEQSVDLLLARGADPALRNDRELAAADFARQAGRDALADRLAKMRR